MRKKTVSLQGLIKFLSGFFAIGVFCCFMIVSPLSTPVAAGFIAMALLLILALIIGNTRARKSIDTCNHKDRISDPVLVDDTWILRR